MTIGVTLRLLAVMVLWASCFPLIAMSLDSAPHVAFAAMRAALAGLFLLVLAFFSRRPWPRGRQVWALIGLVALGTTSLGFLGMFHAAEFVSPGIATVIANVQPLLAAAFAHAFLNEKLRVSGKVGLLVGFVGIVVLSWPGFGSRGMSGYGLGTAYIIVAAMGVAVGNVGLKSLAGKADAIMIIALQFLIGTLPLAFLSLVTEDISSIRWSSTFVVVLIVLSILGTALAYWIWIAILTQVSLNRANAFTFLIPLFALAIGVAQFEERLGFFQIAGSALILLGVALVYLDYASLGTGENRSAGPR